MKITKFIYGTSILLLLGCDKKSNEKANLNLKNTAENKEVVKNDTIIDNSESIRNFLSSFQNSEEFQLSHIQFPLQTSINSEKSLMNKEKWKHIDGGFVGGINGILYNDSTNLESRTEYTLLTDTSFAIFGYFPSKKFFQEFYFKKNLDNWVLYKYNSENVIPNTNSESFFEFAERFNKNKSFLDSRIAKSGFYSYREGELGSEEPITVTELTSENCNLDGNYIFDNLYFNQPILETKQDKSTIKAIHIQSDGTCYNINWYFERKKDKWYIIGLELP